ncbi:hypothetical protein FB45DRAFT_277369 [Roridomyces roridus]|uniref:Uncharacterized protein n=1 Tax=Roridomyces roridus TaxID=1738132 RepID=A0AAD7C9Z9_9AGAR|nr:hypothetical protein FB45DRAFT_277369 [Roridomyces roridus]
MRVGAGICLSSLTKMAVALYSLPILTSLLPSTLQTFPPASYTSAGHPPSPPADRPFTPSFNGLVGVTIRDSPPSHFIEAAGRRRRALSSTRARYMLSLGRTYTRHAALAGSTQLYECTRARPPSPLCTSRVLSSDGYFPRQRSCLDIGWSSM